VVAEGPAGTAGADVPGAPDAAGVEGPAARHALLRRPRFRAYWTGGLVSNIGTWLQNVTASVLVLDLTHRPLMVGVLNFATFAPVFALSMVGGMLSDRFDRRIVVLASQSVSLVAAAVITGLTMAGRINAITLICLATVLGCSYAIAKPALAALLPALVDKDEIAHATAVNTLQFNIGQVGGSALSALVLSFGSYSLAFALNTVSFAGPLIAMIALRGVPLPAAARGNALRGSGAAGLRFVLRAADMRAVLVAVALSNASVEALRTCAPELVGRLPGHGSGSAGVLVMAYAAGATIGLLCFGRLGRRISGARLICAAFALQAIGVVATAAAGTLVVAALFAVPIGLGFALNIPMLNAYLQHVSPEAFRGRVMSMFSMVHLGLRPLFSLTAGALASVVSVRYALAAFVAFPVLAVVLVGRSMQSVPVGAPPPRRGRVEPLTEPPTTESRQQA
jgi:MFS family permease